MSGARAAEKETGDSSFAARRWLFGPVVLDERALTVHVAGAPVELERKPLEVLLHLLHHAGEIVTKDELLAAVWPGRVLSDSALTSCMHKLREALRDDAQEIIRTQHKAYKSC
jgi:DNA-binding winged helix-turn-helix (wHTH) protein